MNSASILQLTKKENNLISPTFLSDDLTKTMRAIVLMRLFCELILNQPKIKGKEGLSGKTIGHIQLHQAKLQRLAYTFLCKIDHTLVGFYTQTHVFADLFKTFQSAVSNTLPTLPTDEERVQVAVAILGDLQNAAEALESKSDQIIGEMSTVMAQINLEAQHLDQDVNELLHKADSCTEARIAKAAILDKDMQQWKEQLGAFVFAGLEVTNRRMEVQIGPATLFDEEMELVGMATKNIGSKIMSQRAEKLSTIQSNLHINYQELTGVDFSNPLVLQLNHFTDGLREACEYAFHNISNFFSEWHEVAEGISRFSTKLLAAKTPSDLVYIQTSLQLAHVDWVSIQQQIETLTQRAAQLKPTRVEIL